MATGIRLDQRYDYTVQLAQRAPFFAKLIDDQRSAGTTIYRCACSGENIVGTTMMVETILKTKGSSEERPHCFRLADIASGWNGRVITVEMGGETARLLCVPTKEGTLFHNVIGQLKNAHCDDPGREVAFDFSKIVKKALAEAIPQITRAAQTKIDSPKLDKAAIPVQRAVWEHFKKERAEKTTGHAFKMPVSENSEETTLVHFHPFMIALFSRLDLILLQSSTKDGVTIYEYPTFPAPLMTQLLDFLYENKVDPNNDVAGLLDLENFYNGLGMKGECATFYNQCLSLIESKLTKETVMSVIKAAYTPDNQLLLEIADRFLNKNDLNLCSLAPAEDWIKLIKQIGKSKTDIVPMICQHLRESLLSKKNYEFWYCLYCFAKENKNNHAAVEELYQACLKLASQSAGISAKFLDEYPEEKLKVMTTREIKRALKEAELISCDRLVKRLNEYLSADLSDEE